MGIFLNTVKNALTHVSGNSLNSDAILLAHMSLQLVSLNTATEHAPIAVRIKLKK
jgi:hypothetical protein